MKDPVWQIPCLLFALVFFIAAPCLAQKIVFIGEDMKVYTMHRDGSAVQQLSIGVKAVDLSVDSTSQRIYWSDVSNTIDSYQIRSAGIDGSSEQIVIGDFLIIKELVVDEINDRIYFMGIKDDPFSPWLIYSVNIDGIDLTSLVTLENSNTTFYPHGLEVDAERGLLYWLKTLGGIEIFQSTISGESITRIVEDIPAIGDGGAGIDLNTVNGTLILADGFGINIFDSDTPFQEAPTESQLEIIPQRAVDVASDSVCGTFYWSSDNEYIGLADPSFDPDSETPSTLRFSDLGISGISKSLALDLFLPESPIQGAIPEPPGVYVDRFDRSATLFLSRFTSGASPAFTTGEEAPATGDIVYFFDLTVSGNGFLVRTITTRCNEKFEKLKSGSYSTSYALVIGTVRSAAQSKRIKRRLKQKIVKLKRQQGLSKKARKRKIQNLRVKIKSASVKPTQRTKTAEEGFDIPT